MLDTLHHFKAVVCSNPAKYSVNVVLVFAPNIVIEND
jgi:hypothetical protein